MTNLSRRGFLTGAGLGLATLLVRPHLSAFAGPVAGKRTLVVVVQRGAVDGLAMVLPHGDPDFAAARPTLAPKLVAGMADLDGFFGLHAGLAQLMPHWAAKRLAIVPAVGLPNASRSHFAAQDLLEQGGPDQTSGWANRLIAPRAQAQAIAVGNTLPRSLAGTAPSLVIEETGEIGIARKAPPARRRELAAAFGDLYAAGDDPFAVTARRALASASNIERALANVPSVVGAKGPIGQALLTAARLIRADLGAELIVVDSGGWDTHTNEAGRLDRELGLLGAAIAAFAADLGDRLGDVTLVTVSEFGRTVRENGTGGTDHGTANMSLVLGGTVAGGRIVGTFPGLRDDQRFEGRDLAITTDVRDLLAEAIGTLDVPSELLRDVFPQHERRALGLFSA